MRAILLSYCVIFCETHCSGPGISVRLCSAGGVNWQRDWGFTQFTNPDVSVWEPVSQEKHECEGRLVFQEGKEQSEAGGMVKKMRL